MVSLMLLLFFAIPIAAIVFFIVSLVRYLAAKGKARETQNSADLEKLKRWKLLLIVSSVIVGVLSVVVVGFMILLLTAIAYM